MYKPIILKNLTTVAKFFSVERSHYLEQRGTD